MAVRNGALATLMDVTAAYGEAGEAQGQIAEILTKDNAILDDISWKEGNLVTGERTWVRTSKPGVSWRRYNQGVPRTKGNVGSFDEASAQLAATSQMDRSLAVLGGNPAKSRMAFAKPFFDAMNEEFAETLFYGNSAIESKEFTGLAPRYNSLNGVTGDWIIDCGGTGVDNRSMWLVNWGEDTVTGLYPKGTKAGLMHMDATANLASGPDGFPIGDLVLDEEGNSYLGYSDFFQWDCGLSVKDHRHAVRAANIDFSLLTKDRSTGTDLEDAMAQMIERVQSIGPNAAFYVPRPLGGFLRRQALHDSRGGRGLLGFDTIGGRKVTVFDGIPIRSIDALNVDEARVVA
ncbi:major capsid protein [Sphingomonas sp. HF-S3]|uniref:Major capsid protein n=1 Tax=Sphingomonas rustica TaxID=3103142 RepID=A0ABV0BFK4_9SPHN